MSPLRPPTFPPLPRLPRRSPGRTQPIGAATTPRSRDKADPATIDTGDLDPALQEKWTQDQWARAWRSGLLERLDAQEGAETGDE